MNIAGRCLIGVVVAMALCLSLNAGNQRDSDALGISVADAIRIARAENPELAIIRAGKARAQAQELRARQGYLPTLVVDASYVRLDSSLFADIPFVDPSFPPSLIRRDFGPFEGQTAGVQVVQPLFNARAWNARKQAKRTVETNRFALRRAEDEIALAVVEAYFGQRTAKRAVAAEKSGLRTAERVLEQAERSLSEGLVPPVDVLRARTRVSEMKARVAMAEGRERIARENLRRVLGMEADKKIVLLDPIPEPPRDLPSVVPPLDFLSKRDDVRALRATIRAAEYGTRRARAAYLPEINLLGRYQWFESRGPLGLDEDGWLLGISLKWTPFAGYSQAGELAEARALERGAREELRALRARARAEAVEAHALWRAELLGWEEAVNGVRHAEEALRQSEGRYAEGLDDITTMLRAQAEELGARIREVGARFNAVVAAESYRLAVNADEDWRVER